MNMTTKTYGTPAMGCYLDQANYNNDELSVRIVGIAQGYGMRLDEEGISTLACYEDRDSDEDRSNGDDMDLSDALDGLSEEAIQWLNDQEDRSFMSWYNCGERGAFGLWCDVDSAKEDCGFVSGGEDSDPEDSDYPAHDYRGEWLHISDHGNATLYIREDHADLAFNDVEVWSVV